MSADRYILPAGVVIGLAFIVAVMIDGMTYPEAIATLLVIGVIGWRIENQGISASTRLVHTFIIAIVLVGFAWGVSSGALPLW